MVAEETIQFTGLDLQERLGKDFDISEEKLNPQLLQSVI